MQLLKYPTNFAKYNKKDKKVSHKILWIRLMAYTRLQYMLKNTILNHISKNPITKISTGLHQPRKHRNLKYQQENHIKNKTPCPFTTSDIYLKKKKNKPIMHRLSEVKVWKKDLWWGKKSALQTWASEKPIHSSPAKGAAFWSLEGKDREENWRRRREGWKLRSWWQGFHFQ